MSGNVRAARALALVLIFAGGLGAGLVAGCGRAGAPARAPSAGSRAPRRVDVTLRRVAFDPPSIEAAPGDTVRWRNEDLVPHTVNARDGRFASGNLPPDSTFHWIVTGSDSAAYFCTYHPSMHGVIRIAGPGR